MKMTKITKERENQRTEKLETKINVLFCFPYRFMLECF